MDNSNGIGELWGDPLLLKAVFQDDGEELGADMTGMIPHSLGLTSAYNGQNFIGTEQEMSSNGFPTLDTVDQSRLIDVKNVLVTGPMVDSMQSGRLEGSSASASKWQTADISSGVPLENSPFSPTAHQMGQVAIGLSTLHNKGNVNVTREFTDMAQVSCQPVKLSGKASAGGKITRKSMSGGDSMRSCGVMAHDIEEYEDGDGDGDVKDKKVIESRRRNRDHARRSRMRKKLYVESLVRTVQQLRQENDQYARLLGAGPNLMEYDQKLEDTNRKLIMQNEKLRSLLAPKQSRSTRLTQIGVDFLERLSRNQPTESILLNCVPGATLHCDGFPGIKTLQDYVNHVKSTTHKWVSKYRYITVSTVMQNNKVVLLTYCTAVHDKMAGPTIPQSPPKVLRVMVVHHFHFNEDDKIVHCDKVFDFYTTLMQLHWPVHDSMEEVKEKLTQQFRMLQGPDSTPDVYDVERKGIKLEE